jgi:hypothetical protein
MRSIPWTESAYIGLRSGIQLLNRTLIGDIVTSHVSLQFPAAVQSTCDSITKSRLCSRVICTALLGLEYKSAGVNMRLVKSHMTPMP